jgi:serine protease AprX
MKDMGSANRGDDLIASYSSKGPTQLDLVVKPDLVAPGNNVISAISGSGQMAALYPDNVVPVGYYKGSNTAAASKQYFRLSGTSIASPMVAGAAALIIQKDPTLTPDTVKARLMKTATKNFPGSSVVCDPITAVCYTSYYDVFTVGAGYLDVWAALNNSDRVAAGYTARSPAATADTYGNVRMVSGSTLVWGTSLVWGTTLVWGTSTVTSTAGLVEPTTLVWGTTTMQGYSVVWGTSLVWGTGVPFSESLGISGEN